MEQVVQELHQRHLDDQETMERHEESIHNLQQKSHEALTAATQEAQSAKQLRGQLQEAQQGVQKQYEERMGHQEALRQLQQKVSAAEERVATRQQDYDMQLKEVQSQLDKKNADIQTVTDRHASFVAQQDVTQTKTIQKLQEQLQVELKEKKQLQEQQGILVDDLQEQSRQAAETDKQAYQVKLHNQQQSIRTLKTKLQEAKTTPTDEFQERMEIATAAVDAATQREQTSLAESQKSLQRMKQAQTQLKAQYVTLTQVTQEQEDSKGAIETLQQELQAAVTRAEIAEAPRPGWRQRLRTRLFGPKKKKRR